MKKWILATALILGTAQPCSASVRFITDWLDWGFGFRVNDGSSKPEEKLCDGYKFSRDNCLGNKILSDACASDPNLYKNCSCPNGLVDREEWAEMLSVSDFFFGESSDVCVKLKSCEELGYVQKPKDCQNGALLCPFDKSVAFCN